MREEKMFNGEYLLPYPTVRPQISCIPSGPVDRSPESLRRMSQKSSSTSHSGFAPHKMQMGELKARLSAMHKQGSESD